MEELDCSVGAVLDLHVKNEERDQIKGYLSKTGKNFWGYNHYYNGGVLFVRDTERAYRLFADWHRIWNEDREKFGISIDQPSFAQANIANDRLVTEIDGRYNCQIFMPGAKKIFLPKVIHYFYDTRRDFSPIKKILNQIQREGFTDDIKKKLSNPQALFNINIIVGEETVIYNSPMSILGRKLSRDFKWTNTLAKFIYGLFGFNI